MASSQGASLAISQAVLLCEREGDKDRSNRPSAAGLRLPTSRRGFLLTPRGATLTGLLWASAVRKVRSARGTTLVSPSWAGQRGRRAAPSRLAGSTARPQGSQASSFHRRLEPTLHGVEDQRLLDRVGQSRATMDRKSVKPILPFPRAFERDDNFVSRSQTLRTPRLSLCWCQHWISSVM
jgi:hypothetical protein